MSLGRPPKDPRRETSDTMGCGQGTEGDENKAALWIGQPLGRFVRLAHDPARGTVQLGYIPHDPWIHIHQINRQNSPGTRGTDDPAVKECGGGRSLLGMIHAAATQATRRTANKKRRGKPPCQLYLDGFARVVLQGSRSCTSRENTFEKDKMMLYFFSYP